MAAGLTASARNLRRLAVALASPAIIFSAALVLAVAQVLGLWPRGVVLLGLWVASGALVLRRRIEDAVVRGREGLRRPSSDELVRLTPAWTAVCQAASVDPAGFSLWVQRSSRINAFAAPGHTVAVTEAAANGLSTELLQAILAHELGHHLGGHSRISVLRYWYSLPASYLFQAATYFGLALATSQTSTSRVTRTAIPVVLLMVIIAVTIEAPIAGLVVIVFVGAHFGMLWVRRQQEFEADAAAQDLGYGQALAAVFSTMPASDAARSTNWIRSIGETHPPRDERISRLKLNS